MNMEERIAAYLDGELDPRAAAEVEAALLDPAVSELLAHELMLRELMGTLGPQEAPPGLLARIEKSLGVHTTLAERLGIRSPASAPGSERKRSRLGTAIDAARVSAAGARLAAASVTGVGHSMTLIAEVAAPGLLPAKPKPLWRGAAGALWRRRK